MCPSQLDGASSAPTLTARDREAFQLASSLCDTTLAMCHQVIERHGPIRPFTRIHTHEQQRLRQWRRLLLIHTIPLPGEHIHQVTSAQESLPISCTKALHWEQQRLQRLRQLLQQSNQDDLHSCLSQSIRAIEQQHLPALARCGGCRNTLAGGCPDGPQRPASAPPRRCVARIEQDWLWTPKPE